MRIKHTLWTRLNLKGETEPDSVQESHYLFLLRINKLDSVSLKNEFSCHSLDHYCISRMLEEAAIRLLLWMSMKRVNVLSEQRWWALHVREKVIVWVCKNNNFQRSMYQNSNRLGKILGCLPRQSFAQFCSISSSHRRMLFSLEFSFHILCLSWPLCRIDICPRS